MTWVDGSAPAGSVFAVVPIRDDIGLENLAADPYTLVIEFEMTVPLGADATDFEIQWDFVAVTMTLVSGQLYSGSVAYGSLAGLATDSKAFHLLFDETSELGTYALDIYATANI